MSGQSLLPVRFLFCLLSLVIGLGCTKTIILGKPPKVPEPGIHTYEDIAHKQCPDSEKYPDLLVLAKPWCIADGDPLVIYLERIEQYRDEICATRQDCDGG